MDTFLEFQVTIIQPRPFFIISFTYADNNETFVDAYACCFPFS